MTANKMPLMLDNTVPMDLDGVDDLFGDGVALSIPVRSHSKQLTQRADALRNHGCCQAVAWSRAGTIATITPDGQALELRFLRCHPVDGSWDLSKPTTCHLVQASPGVPLVHLEWSTTHSPELAVFDAGGRVTIVSFSISLNHPFVTRKWETDSIDDANLVVGAHWLAVPPPNHQKPYNVLYGPAVKNGNMYLYESSFVHATGPSHPHPSKSALMCITKSGMVKMFWSQNNNRMEETAMELESVNSAEDLVTHAALAPDKTCSDKKFLLVAVATSSRQLRLLKIEIQWAGPGSQPDKNPLPQNARLSPSLVEKHLAATTWLQTSSGDANDDASMPELSQLHVLPSLLDNTGKTTAPPMVFTIRSHVPTAGSYQMAQSILDRWEAVSEPRQNLHSAFEQLGNRRNSGFAEQTECMMLRKLDPIVINKMVVGVHRIEFGKVLILTMADGTIEYRDRFTFEEIYTAEDIRKVMNFRQVGWTFADDGPCQQVAFSPTCCSMIQMADNGNIRWSKMSYPLGDIGDSNHDVHYAATIAMLTLTAASAMWYQVNFDDMLAIIKPLSKKKRFTQDLVSEIIRVLKIQVDYSEEVHHDSLMRNAPLQSCLSIMNSLGFRGELKDRTFQSKFAMVCLNVRNVVILITLASNTPMNVREKMSPLDEHEVVEALAGCAKWSLDLLAWLTNSLFLLMLDKEFMAKLTREHYLETTPYLQETNDISLHLLLSSSSRSFLLAICRRIAHLEALSTRAIEFYRRQSAMADQSGASKMPNLQLQQAYQKMQHITTTSLIKASEFEKLINVLGSDMRHTYQTYLPSILRNGPNPPQGKNIDAAVKTTQMQSELGFLLAAPLPPAFLPVIKKFLTKDLVAFRNLVDPAKLFFANYDLLGVADGKRGSRARPQSGVYVDLFKRVELKQGSWKQLRRCTRCASVMEDVFGSRPGFTFVLNQQRKCSCGGLWALLPQGKLLV